MTRGRLYAIGDLHLRYQQNRDFLESLPTFANDWLIVAGDVGETEEHLTFAWRILTSRFSKIIWVPGNHELWTMPGERHERAGPAKYLRLVEICRDWGVLTPEDPYSVWTGDGGPCLIAPLFVLYDYSFRPDHVGQHEAVAWAMESGILCADEKLLGTDPHGSVVAWCHERLRMTESLLGRAAMDHPLVLINHFPLREELARLPAVPRFSIWCGTRRTQDWHTRFGAKVVVTGHLHIGGTTWIDGVRFEEVSLGYPEQWDKTRPAGSYLREILPGPAGASL